MLISRAAALHLSNLMPIHNSTLKLLSFTMFLLSYPNSLHTLILRSVTPSSECDKSFLEVAVPDSKVKGITVSESS